MDALGDVSPGVLLFPHRDQRIGIGALDPDEYADEIRLAHQLHEVRVIR